LNIIFNHSRQVAVFGIDFNFLNILLTNSFHVSISVGHCAFSFRLFIISGQVTYVFFLGVVVIGGTGVYGGTIVIYHSTLSVVLGVVTVFLKTDGFITKDFLVSLLSGVSIRPSFGVVLFGVSIHPGSPAAIDFTFSRYLPFLSSGKILYLSISSFALSAGNHLTISWIGICGFDYKTKTLLT